MTYPHDDIPSEEEDAEWARDIRSVSDWAARNGLRTSLEIDPSIKGFDSEFLNVVADPLPDSDGIKFARFTIAALFRYRRPVTGDWVHEVHLTRHGSTHRDPVIVSVSQLHRFTLEARHLDRLD